MKRNIWVLAGAAVLVAVTASGCVVAMSSPPKAEATPAASAFGGAVNTATVERGKLSAMVSLNGTLTYRARSDGSPYSVINKARGTYTKLPDAGDKVACGDVLYRVNHNPVLLLCGTVPAYRDLHTGDVGEDVRQLNRNLHTLGYDAKAGVVIDPDDNNFTSSTEKALEMLQHDKGFAVGDVMARQDPDLTAQLRQAQATLANAQAAYDKLAQSPLPQDVGAAAATVDVARAQLAAAQHALAAAQTTAEKGTAAAQVAVANVQQALGDAQQNAATIPGIVQQQIEQAKAKLYADQTTWDAQVGRGAASKEQRQSALDVDQAAIDQAMAAAKQQMVQAQQTVNQAQQALKTAQANLEAAQAKDGQALRAAQDQVANAQAALGQTQASYNKTAARPTKADLDAAAAQVEAQKAAVQLTLNNLDAAGELHIDDAIFLPGPVRIVKVTGVVGGSAAETGPSQTGAGTSASGGPLAGPGTQVLSATSDTPEVQVDLDPSQQSEVKTGDPAQITLPGNKSVTGKVDRLGRVAQVPSGQNKNAGDATIPAYISLDDLDKARGLDQAPVQVEITTEGVESALNVPVTALVGKSGGGLAVEVVRDGGRRELVAVKVGLFDTAGGRVQIDGDVRQGDRVVVPSL